MLGNCGLRVVLWERVTYRVVCVGGGGFCCRHGVYGLYVAWPGRKKYVSVMITLSVSSTLPWE